MLPSGWTGWGIGPVKTTHNCFLERSETTHIVTYSVHTQCMYRTHSLMLYGLVFTAYYRTEAVTSR